MSLEKLNAVWPGWETVRLLGRGSFGAVYEIRQDADGLARSASVEVFHIPQREAEIETLRDEGYDDAELAVHFQALKDQVEKVFRELAALGDGAKVVRCSEIRSVLHQDGIGWDVHILTELLAPLPSVLSFPAEEEKVIRIGTDLCLALAASRDLGIHHGDISPKSVFVAGDWTYRLGDFGLADILADSEKATVKADAGLFTAPEVLRSEPCSEKADLYSVGMVLYWLLNEGRCPFLPLPPASVTGAQQREARARRQAGEALPAPAHGSDALRQIVRKACAFDPAARFCSAEEMLLALEALLPPVFSAPAGEENVASVSDAQAAGEISRNQIPLSAPVPEEEDEGTVDTRRPTAAGQVSRNQLPLSTSLPEEDEGTVSTRRPRAAAAPKAASTQQPPKKKARWPLFAALALLVLLIGGAVLLLHPAGDTWAAPRYEWSEDHSAVTAVRVCENDPDKTETETAQAVSTVLLSPTCEAAGKTAYTASFQNPAFETQTEELADLPALGHSWGPVRYTWTEDYSSCTAERVCLNDPAHRESETVETSSRVSVAATCGTAGNTTYTADFQNTAFLTQTKTLANLPALGHDWGEANYLWSEDYSTCTAERVCANTSAHKETETVQSSSRVSVAPTCLTTGEAVYTASFSNPAFETQSQEVSNVPALGHSWGTVSYTWSSDYGSCTAERVCLNDPSHKETETVRTSSRISTAASCLSAGSTTYTAAFKNSAFAAQTKTVSDVPASGHRWGAADYTWSSDKSTCTATRVCLNDPSHKETETVHTTSLVSTPATCTDGGKTTYSAVFTNSAFAAQTRVIADQIALGHNWQDATYSTPKTCSRCGATSGSVKGWVGEPSSYWGDTTIMLRGYQTTHPKLLESPIYNCMKLTMEFRMSDYSGYPFGEWYFYIRDMSGKWQPIRLFEVSENASSQTYTVSFSFDPRVSFDAFAVAKRVDSSFDISYSLYIYDVQQYVG